MAIVQKQQHTKTEFPLLSTHCFGTPQLFKKHKYFLPSVLWVLILFLSSYVKSKQTWPTICPKMAHFKHLQTDIACIAGN